MHEFLKFCFYVLVGVLFFYRLLMVAFPRMHQTLAKRLKTQAEAVKAYKENPDTSQPVVTSSHVASIFYTFLVITMLVLQYVVWIGGLLTSNWFVFAALFVLSILLLLYNKLTKHKTEEYVVNVPFAVFISLLYVVGYGFALVNAYQLHLSFTDLFNRF